MDREEIPSQIGDFVDMGSVSAEDSLPRWTHVDQQNHPIDVIIVGDESQGYFVRVVNNESYYRSKEIYRSDRFGDIFESVEEAAEDAVRFMENYMEVTG